MGIDREWDEPVYQQVAGILRRQIETGEIEARRPVPSIRTLCETYGIARATATKSLRILADEGLIRRVAGRGWFVVPGQWSGRGQFAGYEASKRDQPAGRCPTHCAGFA